MGFLDHQGCRRRLTTLPSKRPGPIHPYHRNTFFTIRFRGDRFLYCKRFCPVRIRRCSIRYARVCDRIPDTRPDILLGNRGCFESAFEAFGLSYATLRYTLRFSAPPFHLAR
jgi:hypothetical protein